MQGYGIAGCQIASECQGHASIISIMIFELRRAWRATLERYFATLYWCLGKLQSFASLSEALPGREEEAAIAFARCARCAETALLWVESTFLLCKEMKIAAI